MQITNGRVSRMVKPADYEARTVELSFALEPGDDVDQALVRVGSLCERYARNAFAVGAVVPGLPTEAEVAALAERTAEVISGRRTRKPPVVESAARVEAQPASADTPAEPAPVQEPEPASPPAEEAPAAKAISNTDLQEAIVATHARLAHAHEELRGDDVEKRDARGFLIRNWRDTVTGVVGMPVGQMDQAQRARFLEGLKTLKPDETY